uniref:Uncharacterized protein n=1 Tax=Solanum lycopersicum TaxID=4081 RepID=K4DDC2_SOLLC
MKNNIGFIVPYMQPDTRIQKLNIATFVSSELLVRFVFIALSALLYFYLDCAHAKTACHHLINGVILDFLPSRHSFLFTVILWFS